jgi:hypothetical protein
MNGISARYGLGVLLESSLFSCQAFVVFARQVDGTDRRALAAAGAFGKVNIARVFTDAGFEFSRFAFEF